MPINRIVKMTFKPGEIDNFLSLFRERKQAIRNFPGCLHLELWRDENAENIFFTYSIWEDTSRLDHYRFSEFFKDTWAKTRSLFESKAEAWTLKTVQI